MGSEKRLCGLVCQVSFFVAVLGSGSAVFGPAVFGEDDLQAGDLQAGHLQAGASETFDANFSLGDLWRMEEKSGGGGADETVEPAVI